MDLEARFQSFLDNPAMSRQIDDHFKAVVGGDDHMGDGSRIDDFQKNEALYLEVMEDYLNRGFLKIDGGDNFDLWKFDTLEEIQNAHPKVIQLNKNFKQKGGYLKITGNHDRVLLPFFPEAIVLHHTGTDRRILIVHGYQEDWINDEGWEAGRAFVRHVWRPLEESGIKDPTTPPINIVTARPENPRKHLEVMARLKAWAKSKIDDKIDLVVGHLHFAEGADNYHNWGCFCGSTTSGGSCGERLEIIGDQIKLKPFT